MEKKICLYCGKEVFSKNTSYCKECARYRHFSYQFWVIRYGMSEDEAKIQVGNLQKRDLNYFINKYGEIEGTKKHDSFRKGVGEKNKKNNARLRKEDPDKLSLRAKNSKIYWISKGYTEEEAEEQLNKQKLHHSKKIKQAFKDGRYIGKLTTSLEYWLQQCDTVEEAKEKRSERQRTFTKEKCILKTW